MTEMTRIVSKTLGLTLAAGLLAVAAVAADGPALVSAVIGSTPGQTIGGIPSGGAPWVVSKGQATLNDNGGLNVHLEGLLLAPSVSPGAGTTGPVTSVSASLVCGGAGGAVMATTPAVPLSTEGNAHIKAKVTLPASCIAPVIIVQGAAVNGAPPAKPFFIAATGFNSGSGGKKSGDDQGSDNEDSDH